MNNALVNYGLLFERFLSGAMSVEEFQVAYLDCFKHEGELDGPLFALLDEIFGHVDSFTTDPQLLVENPGLYLDEATLREKVRVAESRLSSLKSNASDAGPEQGADKHGPTCPWTTRRSQI